MGFFDFLKKNKRPKEGYFKSKNQKIFDFTSNTWGHALNIDKMEPNTQYCMISQEPTYCNESRCHGFSEPRVSNYDLALITMKSGKTAVVQFFNVENCNDPRDMFFATARILGYQDEITKLKPEIFPSKVSDGLSETAKIALEGRTPESHPEQFYGK